MEKNEGFEIKHIKLNGHEVKAIIPKRKISLEDGVRKAKIIFKKYH